MSAEKLTDTTNLYLSASNEKRREQVLQRLGMLDGYLRQDPDNNALLVDAFETALACSEWSYAERYYQRGKHAGLDPLGWALREGDYWLARKEFPQARRLLLVLKEQHGVPENLLAVIVHNLGYIEFRLGNYAECVRQLQPILVTRTDAPTEGLDATEEAIQCLWLRSQHRLGELEDAMRFALQCDRYHRLWPATAGVASLIAVDAANWVAAEAWCAKAFQQSVVPPSLEAWVASGTLALGRQDIEQVLRAVHAALQINPQEGRTWSLKAYAEMFTRDLDAANASFEKAVLLMPQHIGTWIGKGWCHLLRAAHEPARVAFEQALSLDHNFAESHGSLAVALVTLGDKTKAQEHADIAVRLDRTGVSGLFAQMLLRGDVIDPVRVHSVAERLLRNQTLPGGTQLRDWLRPKTTR